MNTVRSAGDTVVSNMQEDGIARWIDGVRRHHSLTYQHSLLCSSPASPAAFGQHIGLSQRRQADAGTLRAAARHRQGRSSGRDTRKKPGRLTKEEFATDRREHPVMGFEALRGVEGLYADTLESGGSPPRNILTDRAIHPGSTRSRNIRFGPLDDDCQRVRGSGRIRRSYKPAISGGGCLSNPRRHGPQALDKDLVRAFRPFARAQIR